MSNPWDDIIKNISSVPLTGVDLQQTWRDASEVYRQQLETQKQQWFLQSQSFSLDDEEEKLNPFLRAVVAPFEPLMFAGDVTKSLIYGFATGGLIGAARYAWDAISRAPTYFPGGKVGQGPVSGEDIARLVLGGDFDRMSPVGKWATSFFTEIATDPLTFIGAAGLVLKAVGKSTSRLGSATGVQAVEQAGEAVIRFADGTIGHLDNLVQRALNPYALGIEATRGAARFVAETKGISYEEFAGRVVESILNIPIPFLREMPRFRKPIVGQEGEEFVHLPRGVSLTIGDAIFPRRFREVPELVGSPKTGPSIYSFAHSTAQTQLDIERQHIIKFNGILLDSFGVESSWMGIVKQPALHPKAEPIIHEVLRRISATVDGVGIDERAAALNKHYEEIMALVPKVLGDNASAYGITADGIRRVLYEGEDIFRSATLAMTHQITGVSKFLDILRSTADEYGLERNGVIKMFSQSVGEKLGIAKRVEGIGDLPKTLTGGPPLLVEKIDSDVLYPGVVKGLPDGIAFNRKKMNKLLEQPPAWASRVIDDILDVVPLETYLLPTGAIRNVFHKASTKPIEPHNADSLAKAADNLAKVVSSKDLDEVITAINETVAAIPDIDIIAKAIPASSPNAGIARLLEARWMEASGDTVGAAKAYAMAQKRLPIDTAAQYYIANKLVKLSQGKPPLDYDISDGLKIITEGKEPGAITGDAIRGFLRYVSGLPRERVRAALEGSNNFWSKLVKGALFRDKEALVGAYKDIVAKGDTNAISVFEEVLRRVDPTTVSYLQEAGIALVSQNARKVAVLNKAWERFHSEFPHWPDNISPEQWVGNILDGYMRRVVMSRRSAVTGLEALRKGRYVVLPEFAGEDLEQFHARLMRMGLDGQGIAKVEKELAKLEVNGNRLVSLETVVGILKDAGVRFADNAQDSSLEVMRILGIEQSHIENIKRIVSRAQRTPAPGEGQLRNAKAFSTRMDAADIQQLLDFASPVVSTIDLSIAGTRTVRSNELLYGVYRALREAGDKHGIQYMKDSVEPNEIRWYTQIPNRPDAYGPLAGKWIPEALAVDLFRELAAGSADKTSFTRFISLLRGNLLNWYDTTARNAVGSLFLMQQMVGTDFTIDTLLAAPRIAKELTKFSATGERGPILESIPPEWLRDIARSGITGDIFGQLEDSLLALEKHVSTADKIIDAFKRWTLDLSQNVNIRGFPVGPLGLFTLVENTLRIGIYVTARNRKMSEAESLWLAQNVLGNYVEIPRLLRIVRDTGLVPFPTFLVMALGRTAKSLAENPKYPVSVMHLTESSWASTDPGERARASVAMQDWMKSSFPVALPFRLEDGSLAVAPLLGMLPYVTEGDDLVRSLLGGGLLGILADIYVASLSGGQAPLGKEFGRGTVFDPMDDPLTKVAKTAVYSFNVMGPAFLTRGIGTPGDWAAYTQLAEGNIANLRPNAAPLVRLMATYTHPDTVKLLEKMYLRDYDTTPAEVVARTLGLQAREVDVRKAEPGRMGGLAWLSLIRRLEAELDSIENYYRERIILEPNNRDALVRERQARLANLYKKIAEAREAKER